MRNAEYGMRNNLTPFRIPHSAFRIPPGQILGIVPEYDFLNVPFVARQINDPAFAAGREIVAWFNVFRLAIPVVYHQFVHIDRAAFLKKC